MRVIVISRPDFFDEEHLWINTLFKAGMQRLHLRKPSSKAEQMEALLNRIERRYLARIVLHDHHCLATKYPLGGIHLNARNTTSPAAFKGSVSRSCHTLEEIKQHKASHDYLTLSPIFDSISKQGYNSGFTTQALHLAQKEGTIDSKVIALGGITEDNITEVCSLGFGGVALLGSIWNSSTPIEAAQRILRINHHCNTPKVLSIAGSDPSGGAGIQADIKTITTLGAYAATAITALTIQNTRGVTASYPTEPEIIAKQIEAVMEDIAPQAIKIGMVGNKSTAEAIVEMLQRYPHPTAIYDPVMISTSGHALIAPQAIDTIERDLIPRVTLLTPNRHEAEALWRKPITSLTDMESAARELSQRYGIGVLIKGGHMDGEKMCDILCDNEGNLRSFVEKKITTCNLHGTGCTLSSAIATFVARGLTMDDAIAASKRYISTAITAGASRQIGSGNGPLWHMVQNDFLADYLEI